MILDKETHRDILLEIISKAVFSGEYAETVVELKEAVKNSTAEDAK